MTRALAAFTLAVAGTIRGALADPGCTQETFSVQGTPLSISYCVSAAPRANGADELIVPVSATYSTARGTLRRSSELHFMAGEHVSRVIEGLDLTRVGLTGTLHLTLAYARGLVRVDGALLTPGAITIK